MTQTDKKHRPNGRPKAIAKPGWYVPERVMKKYHVKKGDLAKKMGICNQSLSAMIKSTTNIANIKLMADIIGCSFFEFFNLGAAGDHNFWHDSQCECPSCQHKFGLRQYPSGKIEYREADIPKKMSADAAIPKKRKQPLRGMAALRAKERAEEEARNNGLFS